ncbi:hypothetical protein [Demequina gelatinilytica]|uniref:hypothetical protein n=1 Tax=Demequina gelatinilytica TaxID=1638980 RepID=UPI0007804863|nr:hypothetical protein [Demequina gelatinilytica]
MADDEAAEQQALRSIATQREHAIAFGERMQVIAEVERGGKRGEDVVEFPLTTASQVVRAGLGASHEHLHAASPVWHSREGGVRLPTAHDSQLWTASKGSANALWVLARAERREPV